MNLHVLCGLPGSGKSTLAKKLSGYKISTDELRAFLWGDATVIKHDKIVFDIAIRLLDYTLSNQLDVIFDATNLKKRNRKPILQVAKKHQAQVTLHWVHTPLDTALERNTKRERIVPPEIITKMHSSIEPPSLAEGINLIKTYNENLRLKKVYD
ncbi:ATP-binding protein [Desulfuribacillus alkaliarsenatis]|uniref:Kinase n=1 Tax=Desulfuribacillus alkaliarsenatis TaxID=766136 RepID=A0A1E5FYS1_9FIRM|nr:ATP-binding protein [Desulfuribacillus alkaliarsenatis]OEF95722.1 hypothetical protein BHF68_11495 [Desulfuribacillus alkaliarsenatis]